MYCSNYLKSFKEFEHNPADGRSETADDSMIVSELECQTILKQRQELQLLIGELKDRDRELNDMVSAHRQQLTAWDKDRQRLLSLEKRNTKLESEVRKRNEQLRLLVHRLKMYETKQNNKDNALEAAHTKLLAAEKAVGQSQALQQDLEDTNCKLNESLTDMTDQIERLEAKEHDFVTQLQLKNGELVEAESEISELNAKLRHYEADIKELQDQNNSAQDDVEQQRNKFRQCRAELDRGTAEMATKTGELIALRQEMIKIREEMQRLRRELYLAEEQLKRKEEVIRLQKSKQQRADSELAQLRQLYERQQEELAILQVNLENSQGILAKQEEKLNLINFDQLELDKVECCSQTTNDLLEEARRTAEDNSFLATSSSPKSTIIFNQRSSPRQCERHPISLDRPSQSPTFSSPSTCKLQKLLDESRQIVQSFEKRSTSPGLLALLMVANHKGK